MNELANPKIDIDVISFATPNGFREVHALKALEFICHIVIEKPKALTKAGCERIITNT